MNPNNLLIRTLMCALFQGATWLSAQTTGHITLLCDQEHQTIDGFGVGEADWADDVFVFPQRGPVLDALFSEQGLRANLLRGEIFPHYSNDSLHCDFALQSDTSQQVARDGRQTLEKNDLLRRGQFWLTAEVHRRYPDVRLVFSTWSPPAWMKEGGHATPDYPASHGNLKQTHYQSFADYLTTFCKAFQSIGIPIYGVSPSNEPGYAAPWNSCVWSAKQMSTFIHDYLLPTFTRQGVDAKVIFGENPAWSTVFDKLEKISSASFVNQILSAYPDWDSQRLITAGHGYVLPDTIPLPAELRRTPILPFTEAEKRNIPMWVTEISDITPLDTSMEDGLYWADMFHQYLMNARVSALIWWLGAQPTHTNESLIVLNQEAGTYVRTKRYDTFGNYSRYIPIGSRGIENQTEGLPEGVRVTSFRKGSQYTAVLVNPTHAEVSCSLQLKGAQPVKALHSYTTTADTRWQAGEVALNGTTYSLVLPPKSVVTYTGECQ